MRYFIIILLIVDLLFFISGCFPVLEKNNAFLANISQINENKTPNQTEIITINLSSFINVSTVNLSLGVRLCDLLPYEKGVQGELGNNTKSCLYYHSTKSFFMCEILRPYEARELCFLSAAGRTRDSVFCGKLHDNILKERCKQYVINEEKDFFKKILPLNNSDSRICRWDSQKGFSKNQSCICPDGFLKQPFGIGYACIPEICDWIYTFKSTQGRFLQTDDYCVTASSINSLGSCNFMETEREKDICVAAYVLATGSREPCDSIKNEILKKGCIGFIENGIS